MCRRSPSKFRRREPSAISLSPSRSSSPASFARRRETSRRNSARRLATIPGIARVVATPNGYLNLYHRARSRSSPPAFVSRSCRRRRRERKRSSSTRRSTRTRRRTSATSAMPRSATRSCGSCVSAARRSRPRTTSTTRAFRWPTSSSGSGRSKQLTLDAVRTIADTTRFDYYCWDLYSRVTEWYDGDKQRLAIRARRSARPRARRQRHRRDGHVHRRSHRPRAPEDDGAAQHRLRPADLRGRHPAAALLDPRVRNAESPGRGVPADGRQARRLLGHANRRRNRESRGRTTEPRTSPTRARIPSSERK